VRSEGRRAKHTEREREREREIRGCRQQAIDAPRRTLAADAAVMLDAATCAKTSAMRTMGSSAATTRAARDALAAATDALLAVASVLLQVGAKSWLTRFVASSLAHLTAAEGTVEPSLVAPSIPPVDWERPRKILATLVGMRMGRADALRRLGERTRTCRLRMGRETVELVQSHTPAAVEAR